MMMTLMMMTMMTSNGCIRKIDLKDLQAVKIIEDEAFQEHAYNENEIKDMLLMEGGESYLFEIDEQPAGYVSFYIKNGKCRVESIGVRPQFQRNGIGKKLMALVEQRCNELNAKSIILETFERNIAAISLYERLGYEVIGKIINYYNIPFNGSRDAVRLKKRL